MAQDGGMFSVRRHRETLGPVSHNVSAIPMPASAMKRTSIGPNYQQQQQQAPHTTHHVRTTSASRMSLAPGRPAQPNFQRSSSGENLPAMGFATVQRPSSANFLSSTTGNRKSYAPVASTPAPNPPQLLESTQRRSSVYSARPSAGFGAAATHQSFFATAPPQNGIPVDPRRLRLPEYRNQIGQELLEFLAYNNFELEMKHTLSQKWLTSPTSKDFNMLFQFLYRCIDPAYRFQKSIDQEVPLLLKQLRYPFEKNINKSQLTAVGGNNWSTFLGLLHWMMQLCKMMEAYSTGSYDEACAEAGYDVTADRITFQFLSDSYKEWLSMEDDEDDEEESRRRIEPHIQAMAAKFEQANQANIEQIKALEADSKKLQDQIDELAKSVPLLAKLDETTKVLEEDRVKFENYNVNMESKVEKYTSRAQLLQQEIEKCEQEIREAEDDKAQLQRRVDEQGISVQDIDRMNSERERLQKGVETTAAKLEEVKERTAQKEGETSAKLDELESTVEKFNSLGYQIGVIPSTASNAHGRDYELRLHVSEGPDFTASQLGSSKNPQRLDADRLLKDPQTGYQPQHLLKSDLKATKKALQDLRKEISERRNASLEEDMAKMDMLDKTKEALDDKYAEMDTLGHRMRAAREEFEKTKEITNAQTMASDAQIEKMEKELAKMRAGLTESVQLMEQREMNTNLEYEELTVRSSALREELHTELERMLNDIIKFKIHIQSALEAYEEFVAKEVEQECEEQEAAEVREALDAVQSEPPEDDDDDMDM